MSEQGPMRQMRQTSQEEKCFIAIISFVLFSSDSSLSLSLYHTHVNKGTARPVDSFPPRGNWAKNKAPTNIAMLGWSCWQPVMCVCVCAVTCVLQPWANSLTYTLLYTLHNNISAASMTKQAFTYLWSLVVVNPQINMYIADPGIISNHCISQFWCNTHHLCH